VDRGRKPGIRESRRVTSKTWAALKAPTAITVRLAPAIPRFLVLQPDFVTCGARRLDAERPPLDDHGV
jgi:hypothetical protein